MTEVLSKKDAVAAGGARRITGLDGIRIWAVFLVVASHTGVLLEHGAVGVALLFTLSGFLAVYSDREEDISKTFLSPKAWLRYYLKRFFRIIPLYYFCILYFWFFFPAACFGSWDSVFKHMTFRECGIHFWYLQQEVVMYLFAPPVFLLLALLSGLLRKFLKNTWVIEGIFAVLLLVAAVLCRRHPFLTLKGNGIDQFFRIHLFFMGMAAGYLCRLIRSRKDRISKTTAAVWNVIGNLWIAAAYAITLFSAPVFLAKIGVNTFGKYIGTEYDMWFGAVCMLWIMAAVFCNRGPMPKLLGNAVFVHLSERSYGIYLFHNLLNVGIGMMGGWKLFLIVSFLSICISETLYVLIEKPIGDFGRHLSPRKLGQYYRGLFARK